jgi:hypothetical protein
MNRCTVRAKRQFIDKEPDEILNWRWLSFWFCSVASHSGFWLPPSHNHHRKTYLYTSNGMSRSCFIFERLGPKNVCPGRRFRGFPQSLQANAGMVPQNRPWLLPFAYFSFHSHTIRRCIASWPMQLKLSPSDSQEFPVFNGTGRFITVFTKVRRLGKETFLWWACDVTALPFLVVSV